MPLPNRCQICGEPTDSPVDMCRDCVRAYERQAHDCGEIMFALVWAARRSRWYAERRTARAVRAQMAQDARRSHRG
jgi:hypothetical protein